MCNHCGCCEPQTTTTPAVIGNRPNLPQISYRVGDFSTFRQAMLQAIADYPELAGWRTRQSADYGIGLFEMWAYIGDILTFYQERIANEAFLGTAVWRESVLQLSNLLNYRPANGMAATAYLAFTTDQEKSVSLDNGLLAQSVPASAEDKPQKFETMEPLVAHPHLNKVRVYSKPNAINPLAAGRSAGAALGNISHLALNDQIVVYEESESTGNDPEELAAKKSAKKTNAQFKKKAEYDVKGNGKERAALNVEDKMIAGIYQTGWRQQLMWAPPIRRTFGTNAKINKWTRKFRLFGYDAPAQFFTVKVDSAGIASWQSSNSDYSLTGGKILQLSHIEDDLKENSQLLIVARLEQGEPFVKRVTVTSVEQTTAKLKATNSAETTRDSASAQISLAESLPAGIDVRKTAIYLLDGEAVDLWRYDYPTIIQGNKAYLNLSELGSIEGLEIGRRIILADDAGNLMITKIAETSQEIDHLAVTFDRAIAGNMKSSVAYAYANVAKVSHGETINETLGDGDAAQPFLTFSLKKSPLTYTPQPGAPNGAASSLQLRVDGVLWTETPDLYGHDETARIFIARVDNESAIKVTFGDGKTGATTPTGKQNITATYRQGIGQVGNVGAGSITNLLSKPLGLKEAVNPAPAEGGAEPESVEQARKNAPNIVRTFKRIVSLTDFADAAREYAGIAKARADWHWNDLEQVARLTVAGDDGAIIAPGSETYANLVADLNSRRDPNRALMVVSHKPIPITLVVNLQVDAAYIAQDVQNDVRSALLNYFAFDNLDLGQAIHLSDLYGVIHTPAGVIAADIDQLGFKNKASQPSQVHLPIPPNEIATLADADLSVNLGLAQTP